MVMTQPRHISAVSVADRVAHERNEALDISLPVTPYDLNLFSLITMPLYFLYCWGIAMETEGRTIGYFPYHSGQDSREKYNL